VSLTAQSRSRVKIVLTNDSIGPVLVLPDGSEVEVDVEVRAFFPGPAFEDCQVDLLADTFEFDAPEDGDSGLVVHAVGGDDDLDALAECAGLTDIDDKQPAATALSTRPRGVVHRRSLASCSPRHRASRKRSPRERRAPPARP
jgi:hypothetical protein